ncbi:histidinol-phosphate transaminase [Kushneria indalinina]|uniref:Histidinol-phosphate aminotransferase n=1 Tax=Kushneria indalinina DSM 14324 TaxID=1122140 RepID=A0A3D9DRQ6_9GAMM|nr:histidinol-phosphate transaminase [Kushneria indalinina]REC93407.1 histidinol-phosphate aminotransferase [Kushneria indalinina DSM 14324]
MSKFWSPGVEALTPYVPGEQPRQRMIKLNTNENPYPPSRGVENVLRQFSCEQLRRYPDPESLALRDMLARTYNVTREQVFVGNGSDEVLAFAFRAFFLREGEALAIPQHTYSFYPVYCQLYGIDLQKVALNERWEVPLEHFPEQGHAGIAFANPNAPTGHAHSRLAIKSLLEKQRERVVLVDEAYYGFGSESAVPLTNEHPNLLVTGTFSKSRSLAGMRIGFAIGSRELIEGLERIKDSFNSYPIDPLASAVGIAALEDTQHHDECCRAIMATRENTSQALRHLDIEVLPSQANFLFARPKRHDAASVAASLRASGILVRHFGTPGLSDWLRISVGTEAEMAALVAALEALPAAS